MVRGKKDELAASSIPITSKHRALLAVSKVSQAASGSTFTSALISAEFADAVYKFSLSTVDRINAQSWRWIPANILIKQVKRGWSETKVNDFLALMSAGMSDDDLDEIALGHIPSYDYYKGICQPNNDGDYPDERLSQILALYAVTEAMAVNEHQDPYLYDDDVEDDILYVFDQKLQELILGSEKGKREKVVEIIVNSSIFDVERINEALALNTPSLSSGVL